MLNYQVKIEPQKEGGFLVTIPSLPGCISEGDTIEEALENIQDAAEGYLITLNKKRKIIPLEHSFERIKINPNKVLNHA